VSTRTDDDEIVREGLSRAGFEPPPFAEDPAENGQPRGEDAPKESTWRPVDLTDVLEGRYQPPHPTVGMRADGVGLFYPGRLHTVSSESEAGKTWLLLWACLTELRRGNHVLYIDFEDEEGGVVSRLMTMGGTPEVIGPYFHYMRPEEPLDRGDTRKELREMIMEWRPTLATLDGVTEAMSVHGLDPLDNADVASFGRKFPRWVSKLGPAFVSLDHVVKNAEGRGRYGIGAVHKLNGLDGAAYTLENRQSFGVGLTGKSGVFIAKDRPAQLRRHAVPTSGGLHLFADLLITSRSETSADVTLTPPADREGGFRPTVLMQKVAHAMARSAEPELSQKDIEARVKGKSDAIRQAIACLIDEGYVAVRAKGNAKMHSLVKPYTGDEQ
jgi:hypothetical protein